MTGRALVLGGGGVTGVAWELGVLAGLAEHGVDLSEANLVAGTSAGSVVGAELTSGVSLADLYAAQLAPPGAEIAARMGLLVTLRYGWVLVRSRDPVKARARFGRMALASRTVSPAERRAVFDARLATRDWPARRLLITAVDADSGEFAAFDAASGVGLVDAVGASCAVPGVWPPVSINGQRWIDGGMRSAANADLAADCEQIVVIAPLVRGFRTMPSVATQVAELRSAGRAVVVVSPDQAALAAIGRTYWTRPAGSRRPGPVMLRRPRSPPRWPPCGRKISSPGPEHPGLRPSARATGWEPCWPAPGGLGCWPELAA